jgi:hypothetical protein
VLRALARQQQVFAVGLPLRADWEARAQRHIPAEQVVRHSARAALGLLAQATEVQAGAAALVAGHLAVAVLELAPMAERQ